jgi:hypothetical protein
VDIDNAARQADEEGTQDGPIVGAQGQAGGQLEDDALQDEEAGEADQDGRGEDELGTSITDWLGASPGGEILSFWDAMSVEKTGRNGGGLGTAYAVSP